MSLSNQGKRSWNVLTWLPSLLCWFPLVKGHPTASWSLHILSCIVHPSVSNQDPDPRSHRGTFYLSLKSLKAESLSMRHEGNSGSRVPLRSQPAWIPWDFILGSHENASRGGAGTIQKMCSNLEKKGGNRENLSRHTRLVPNTESLTQKVWVLKDRKVEGGHSRKEWFIFKDSTGEVVWLFYWSANCNMWLEYVAY